MHASRCYNRRSGRHVRSGVHSRAHGGATGARDLSDLQRRRYRLHDWNAVIHHVPKGVTPELAGLVTPMANGVEWSLFDGQVGYNSTVLIQGPGQQGLSQTVICKQAGASLIIVTGTAEGPRAARGRQEARRRPRHRRDQGGSAGAHHGDHRRQGRRRRARLHRRRRQRSRSCSASRRSSARPASSWRRASCANSRTSRWRNSR